VPSLLSLSLPASYTNYVHFRMEDSLSFRSWMTAAGHPEIAPPGDVGACCIIWWIRIRGSDQFFCTMPFELRQQFVAEMAAPARTVEQDGHGQLRAKWVETGPDH